MILIVTKIAYTRDIKELIRGKKCQIRKDDALVKVEKIYSKTCLQRMTKE